MDHIHALTDKHLLRIFKAQEMSNRYLTDKINKLYEKVASDGLITMEEARKLLSTVESEAFLEELRQRYDLLEEGPEKRKILNILNVPAYRYRISRLEALREAVNVETQLLTQMERKTAVKGFKEAYTTSFKMKEFDLAKTTGFKPDCGVRKEDIERGLKHKWQGTDFVERIGINNEKVAENLTNLIDTGLEAGMTKKEMISILEESTGLSHVNTARIVRTETTFAVNEAEHDIRLQLGVEKYRYIATLDEKTSKVCQKLNARVFEVKDKEVGKNFPPMHPNCRSVTVDVFENGSEGLRRARDRNGNNILVPKNITYEEYAEKYL